MEAPPSPMSCIHELDSIFDNVSEALKTKQETITKLQEANASLLTANGKITKHSELQNEEIEKLNRQHNKTIEVLTETRLRNTELKQAVTDLKRESKTATANLNKIRDELVKSKEEVKGLQTRDLEHLQQKQLVRAALSDKEVEANNQLQIILHLTNEIEPLRKVEVERDSLKRQLDDIHCVLYNILAKRRK